MLYKLKTLLNKNRCYCETNITSEQLKKIIKNGGVLVDVRSVQEYEEGHLENAISLPVYDIRKLHNSILPEKSQEIIVYCSTGHRSEKAQKLLKKLGYQNVYNLCDFNEQSFF